MPELMLDGCRSQPLIGYLKSLGVLRTVARQQDSGARGRWRAGTFQLRSEMAQEELVSFFAAEYRPTPILSPWNGRSGFYPKGNTAAAAALRGVESSTSERLAPYRDLIAATRTILDDLGVAEKPEGDLKQELLMALRKRWPDSALEWLDAAVVQSGGEPRYPPVLGSGGNDGSYDFSSNYLEAVIRVDGGAHEAATSLLKTALLDAPGALERSNSAYLQRDSSPTNSPRGDADSLGNPWDLMLAMAGSMTLVGGAARHHADGDGRMTAPFSVRATGAGYGSAVPGEDGHDELWLPLWSGWATQLEIEHLVREARAQVRTGRTVRWARTGLDLARAAGELGVARGISAFERYALLNRSGQSRLAVPAGRIAVHATPAADALRALDGALGRFLRLAGSRHIPRGVERAVRRLESAAFTLASRGRQPDALVTLDALGRAEHAVARSEGARSLGARPVTGVFATPWLELCDDGSPEFAVAASLGSLRDRHSNRRSPAVRDYLHGTTGHGAEYDPKRRHQVSSPSPMGVLAAVHARRHVDAQGSSKSRQGLVFDLGTWADLGAARAFSGGMLDEERVLTLTRAICLLDHDRSHRSPPAQVHQDAAANPSFDVLALAWAGAADEDEPLGPRPGWAARLAAGRVDAVLAAALLGLRQARMTPLLEATDLVAGSPDPTRLGAALLLPLGPRDIARLQRQHLAGAPDLEHKEKTA